MTHSAKDHRHCIRVSTWMATLSFSNILVVLSHFEGLLNTHCLSTDKRSLLVTIANAFNCTVEEDFIDTLREGRVEN